MLRWYPAGWRARYGDELLALMEDTYGAGGRIPWRGRISVASGGIRERLHQLDTSEPGPPGALRGGALLVLCGWAFFVVGGAGYGKLAEHWGQSTPHALRHLPAIGYDATAGAAALGLVVVALGAVLALPSLVSLRGDHGWRVVRRPVTLAAGVVSVTVALSLVVAWRAHGGSSPAARVVGVTWAVSVAASIAVLTAATVAVVRRLDLSRRVLEAEGRLALLLTAVMVVVLGGTALWWAAIAEGTRVLSGGQSGLFSTPGGLSMAVVSVLMVTGMALAVTGAGRVVTAQRAMRGPVM